MPVTTFDGLAARACPLLAKIDVKGYETQVLAGAGESLANPALRGLILELNGSGERYGQSDAAVFSAIAEAGFAPYRYEPFRRRLEPLEGPNRDGGNTLFLRDLAFVVGAGVKLVQIGRGQTGPLDSVGASSARRQVQESDDLGRHTAGS